MYSIFVYEGFRLAELHRKCKLPALFQDKNRQKKTVKKKCKYYPVSPLNDILSILAGWSMCGLFSQPHSPFKMATVNNNGEVYLLLCTAAL
jgi:hypothetical protein